MESQYILTERPPSNKKTFYILVSGLLIACAFGAFLFATYETHHSSPNSFIFTKDNLNPTAMYDLYTHWKNAHSKLYYSQEENQRRFQIFQDNYLFIINYNSDSTKTAKMGLNQYADLTVEEFKQRHSCLNIRKFNEKSKNYVYLATDDLEEAVDWRNKSAVTPVKNQGNCGSCWAFSTTGSLEGLHAIKKGKLVSFSEQQLVDCSASFGNNGCNGGLMDNAFNYVAANGIETEKQYPYQAEDGECLYGEAEDESEDDPLFKIVKHVDVPPNDQVQLAAAVAKQPVSIAIEADQQVFQFYAGGVLNEATCGTNLDHGVLVVGYGKDATSGLDYWIVKNSWGETWGNEGYVWIAKTNDTNSSGICGIASMASYPVL